MNKFTFHYVNDVYWVTIPIYMYVCMYVCIHLSNGALFGECISRKKLLSFFISKLMEFSFKNWNSRGLEWWYCSDEAGRYIDHVFKLKRTLYGLKQAPRTWYERLSKFVLEKGFTRGKIDTTLLIKRKMHDILLVQILCRWYNLWFY